MSFVIVVWGVQLPVELCFCDSITFNPFNLLFGLWAWVWFVQIILRQHILWYFGKKTFLLLYLQLF